MTDDECIKLLLQEARRHEGLAALSGEHRMEEDHRAVASACRRGAQCMGGGKICKSERKRRFGPLLSWRRAARHKGPRGKS